MFFYRWAFRRLILTAVTISALMGAVAQTPPVTSSLTVPAAPTAPLTVEDAVALALLNNPAIKLSVENVQIAQDQLASARSNGLPTAAVNASGTYLPGADPIVFEGNTVGGEKFNASAQASVSQPIWPPSRWRAPVSAAQANVGVNNESLIRTRELVAFQTRQAFFQLLAAQELLAVSEYSVTVSESQLKLANATFEAGTAPKLDVLQAEATLEDALVGLAGAQNNVDVSRATLATQMGFPAGVTITIKPPEELPTAPSEIDVLSAQAYALRPELKQLAFRQQQLRANIELIKLEKKPLVNFQANYNQTLAGASLFSNDGLSFTAVAALTFYNGGKTKADLAAAKKQLEQIDTLVEQQKLSISLEVRQAWLNLQNALKQLDAAQKQGVAADAALEIARFRYEAGQGIILEVEQARLRSIQARTSISQAKFQAQVAAAQLDFAIGVQPAVK